MYAALRRYQAHPRVVKELSRRVEEGFLPIVSQIDGFISYSVIDAGSGALVTISYFETRAGVQESTERATAWVKENLSTFFHEAPETTAGEVTVYQVRVPVA